MSNKQTVGGEKNSENQTRKIVKTIIFLLLIVGVVLAYVFADSIFGENSVFNTNISSNSVINALFQKIPALIKSVQIIVIAVLITIAVRFIMHKGFARSKRGLTIVKLMDSFIKYLIAIVAFLMILSAWGVDTETLLASAGILALVIGLGAQSLIADIIAGVFIVFEGSYQVGDIVVIDDWRGTVDEIGVRTTKIIDAGGNIKVINNSAISTVINQTQELSVASIVVGIEYGESLERVEAIIKDNLDTIKQHIPAIVNGPFYKGVKTLNSSSVDLQFAAKVKEEDLYQVQRDLNREIKLLFDKNNINIPFPQVVINQPVAVDKNVDEQTAEKAKEFTEEQKIVSKGVEEKI